MTELRSDALRELGDRARELGKLTEHPSWPTLREELERVKTQYELQLARKLLTGGLKAPALEQRELDYQRGFFRGAEWILANPEMAEAALNKAMERENSA